MSDPRAKRLKPDTEANAVEEASDIPGEGGRLANGGQEAPSEDVDKAGEDQAIARLKDVQAELEQVRRLASLACHHCCLVAGFVTLTLCAVSGSTWEHMMRTGPWRHSVRVACTGE